MSFSEKDLSQEEFLKLTKNHSLLDILPKSILKLIHNLYISIIFLDDVFNSKMKHEKLTLTTQTNSSGLIISQKLSNDSNTNLMICEGTNSCILTLFILFTTSILAI